jgi:hypothetical protein
MELRAVLLRSSVPADASSTAGTSIPKGCFAEGSHCQAATRHQAALSESQRDANRSEARQARPSHLC